MGLLDDSAVRVGTRDDAYAAEIRRLKDEIEDLRRRLATAERLATEQAATVRELRASGAKTPLEHARDAIRDYGPPPPGEGRHPLQGHRDSMG